MISDVLSHAAGTPQPCSLAQFALSRPIWISSAGDPRTQHLAYGRACAKISLEITSRDIAWIATTGHEAVLDVKSNLFVVNPSRRSSLSAILMQFKNSYGRRANLRVFFKLLFLYIMSSAMFSVYAQSKGQPRLPFKPLDTERALLPNYCTARLGGSKEAQLPWIQQMGKENFSHLHHYCYGLNYMNRVRVSFGSKHHKHYIQTALAQFNYVVQRWPADFYLTAEAKSYKTQLEFQLRLK